jgi:hypothetical protein
MNILLLFIFNIFTGALIYLILTLKIEKNSATFQEKKLKREMAEIIREFNSTAERNITILENHISTLKKLMNENGSLKGIDFTVLDNQLRDNSSNKKPEVIGEKLKLKKITDFNDILLNEKHEQLENVPKNANSSFEKNHSFNITEDSENEIDNTFTKNDNNKHNGFSSVSQKIDFITNEEITINYETERPVNMADLFQNTDDKYMLIAKLYNEGHSVEDISKSSGLPSGEVRLVISLNS